jgi:hypothetical protein
MEPSDRALFVAAYGKLVAEVWADAAKEYALETDPRALLRQYGLGVPPAVEIEVVRDGDDAEPDLGVQVDAWEQAPARGRLLLYVPSVDPISDVQLGEHELDSVVAGLDTSCACCCPCCCT